MTDSAPAAPTAASHPLATLAFDLLADYGVRDVVIAPGSRSAPLTLAAVRHGQLRARIVYDERSAAYTALGIAQQTATPVVLICSSGTAALNFAPAVAEAYYQQIPLIVLTADRPPEWIDQVDNQAIRQNGLYEPHVRGSFTLPVDDGARDTRWHVARIVRDAYSLATALPNGPVHINVPLREPLYRSAFAPVAADDRIRMPAPALPLESTLAPAAWSDLADKWQRSQRKLIVVGQHTPDTALHNALRALQNDPSVAVIGDITSNLFTAPEVVSPLARWDCALASRDETLLARLRPDLVVWCGGQVTSKYLKGFLRRNPPAHLWRVAPGLPAADAFQANTQTIAIPARTFFSDLLSALPEANGNADTPDDYAQLWCGQTDAAATALDQALDAAPFGEYAAVRTVLAHLPHGSHLQLGNSMPIRYANFLGAAAQHLPARVDGNRGTSGIDGTVSTAVGAALTTAQMTTLIVGDLGFFYDRNGLWQPNLPSNLRIVLLNNHGGGIFDVIEGPDSLAAEERSAWFLTPQPLNARRTAEDFGMDYTSVNDAASLATALQRFYAPSDRPALLEIETDMAGNSATYRSVRG